MYSFKNGEQLQVIEKAKLLGVHFNSNLTWDDNTSAIIKRAMSKMWLLRRMKCVNLDQHMIFDYFIKEIQPTVECDVQVWNSAITKKQSNDIERTQKVALRKFLAELTKDMIMFVTSSELLPLLNAGKNCAPALLSNCIRVREDDSSSRVQLKRTQDRLKWFSNHFLELPVALMLLTMHMLVALMIMLNYSHSCFFFTCYWWIIGVCPNCLFFSLLKAHITVM